MGKVIIMGAGLAGLTCAKVLQEAGIDDLLVLEKSDAPGGRVRTDRLELWPTSEPQSSSTPDSGSATSSDQPLVFHLDRGFQVLFTAYPSIQKHLDINALELCRYRPGAVLVKQGKHYLLGDPLRDGTTLFASLVNPFANLMDKWKVLQLRIQLAQQTSDEILVGKERSTTEFIQAFGFSDQIFKHFLQPFYRGILLDPDLQTTDRLFKFYFKMLSEGEIVIPKQGMGQITAQLADRLLPQQLQCSTEVTDILHQDQHIQGVRLQNGEVIETEQVVCATDVLAVRSLLDLEVPDHSRSVTCLYFRSDQSLTRGAYLYLNANGKGWINLCVDLTQVSPDLAPPGQHLYSVSVLGQPQIPDDQLIQACHHELQQWFPRIVPDHLQFLRLYRIPLAQFDQPVGLLDRLPSCQTPIQGLYLAGEYTQQSSIEGAMRSGEIAAQAVLARVGSDPT